MKYTRLKYWRLRRFLTQEQLAEKAHVSELTVSNIERGRKPRIKTALDLAKALAIKPEQLYTDDPEEADISHVDRANVA